jgi:hypothetical protein
MLHEAHYELPPSDIEVNELAPPPAAHHTFRPASSS